MSSTPQEFPQATLPQSDVSMPGYEPGYTLFDAVAVGLATFFGTPVAGGFLMMLNESRLGRTGRGVATFVGTIVLTALVILVGWNIPTGASSVIALMLVFAMRYTATGLQGKSVDEHVKRGGRLGSRWVAFGIGIVFLAVLFGGVFTWCF